MKFTKLGILSNVLEFFTNSKRGNAKSPKVYLLDLYEANDIICYQKIYSKQSIFYPIKRGR